MDSKSRKDAIKGIAYFVDPITEREDSSVSLKFIISHFRSESDDLIFSLKMESPEQRKHSKNYDAELTNQKPELFSSFDQLISANTENHKQAERLPEELSQRV